jgi:hypothetical protein
MLPVVAVVAIAVAIATPVAYAAPPGPAPAQGLTHVGPHYSTSSNWSGYASYAQKPSKTKFTVAQGSWTLPSVSCPGGTQYAAFWVGIDGYNSSSVEQIGTDSDCVNGSPSYYAWYEMYPSAPVYLSADQYPVSRGDTMTARVTYNPSTDDFTLYLANGKANWTYTKTIAAGHPRRLSAEWIAEAPSAGGQVLPLADFGSVTFTGATATDDSGNTGPINGTDWTDDAITLVSSTATATPGQLLSGGTSFSVSVQTSEGGGGGGGFCPPGQHKQGIC